ncbi:MAG: hypothetical protein AB8B99_15920 [Phormidesmis sp.]
MTDNNKSTQNNDQVSDEQLQDVAGGNKIQKTRLEALDTRDSSKSVDDIQKTRLDALDTRDSSK